MAFFLILQQEHQVGSLLYCFRSTSCCEVPIESQNILNQNKSCYNTDICHSCNISHEHTLYLHGRLQYNQLSISARIKAYRPLAGMIFAVGMNILPLCLTFLCYIILVALVMRKRNVAPSCNNNAMKERVTKTSLYICLAFMILTTPVAMFVMLHRRNGWNRNPTKFTLIFDTLSNLLRQLKLSTNCLRKVN